MFVQKREFENLIVQKETERGYTVTPPEITMFRVAEVYPDERKVDIEFAHSRFIERGVSYMSPVIGQYYGVDFVPSRGDVGIVATTAASGRVILGFLGPKTRSEGVKLAEGDIFTKTFEMSSIKQDSRGNILITAGNGNHILLSRDGNLTWSSVTSESSTIALKEFSGQDSDGNIIFQQEFFDELSSIVYDSIESLIESIERGTSLTLSERKPVLRVSAINKLDGEGVPEILDINLDETDGKIIYQVEVLDTSTGSTLSSITLDKNGNIKIEAQKIVYEVDEVEYR